MFKRSNHDYGFWAVVSLALAIILIAAEIFLPSGGLISLVMVVSFISAIYCAYQAWWEVSPVVFWTFSGFSVIAIPTSLLLAFYWLEKSSWGKRIILDAPHEDEVTPFSAEEERLKKYIGTRTSTITPLNPGGIVSINGERIHCFSQGLMLDANQLVRVVGVSGIRLIVEPAYPEDEKVSNTLDAQLVDSSPTAADDIFNTDISKSESEPIDFDISESK